MTDYVVHAEPAVVKISPLGFHRYGSLFLETRTNIKLTGKFNPVPYYLTCRALELLLKAFLLAKGWQVKDVKDKVRHDLERALREAENAGFSQVVRVTEARRREIKAANRYYRDKGFEYFQVGRAVSGYADLPDLRVLDRFAARIVAETRDLCLKA